MMEEDDSSTMSSCTGRPWWARVGCLTFLVAFVLIFTSYVAPDWIELNPERAPRGTKFMKLGLWMSCYSNLHDPYYYDPYLTSGFEGCRWIYYPVVSTFSDLRDFLLPSFIIPVQITYTLCFLACLALFFMILIYLFRYKTDEDGTLPYLIVIGMMLQGAGLLGTVSVVVFGSLSGSRTWAHEWQFNDLSWAFMVAIFGVVLLHLAGVFFLIESFCQYKRKQTKYRGGYFPNPDDHGVPPDVEKFKSWQASTENPAEPVQESQGFYPRNIVNKLSGLLPRIRESFSMAMGKEEEFPHTQHSQQTTYIPSGMNVNRSPSGSFASSEDIEVPSTIPPPPISPRYDDASPSHATSGYRSDSRLTPHSTDDIPREALENILKSVAEPPSPPDSGIHSPDPPKQLFTSQLKDKLGLGNKKKDKKPTFGSIFKSTPSLQPCQSLEELDGPPRVRRPSGKSIGSQTLYKEPLSISIQTLQNQRKSDDLYPEPESNVDSVEETKPTRLLRPVRPISLGPPKIPPPPPPTDPPPVEVSEVTIPIETAPTKENLSRSSVPEPRITSYEQFLYNRPQRWHHKPDDEVASSTPSPRPPTPPPRNGRVPIPDDYGLPPAPHMTPSPTSSKSGIFKLPQRPLPLGRPASAAEQMPEIPRTTKPPPDSPAAAVADILASKQPLSLRIHIQRHKTQSSYRKTVSRGKNDDFAESSI